MATTYTANLGLQKPATSDRNWDIPLNANTDVIDRMTAIGCLAVTTLDIPSSTLHVVVTAGNYVKADGTILSFPGNSFFAIPASSTISLWLTDFGTLAYGSSFPTSAHLRLANVVSGTNSILQILDERIQCSVSGTGLGFLLKSGDTMTGPLTVISSGTNSPLVVMDSISRLIGFFGGVPMSQAPPINSLSSNSSGVPSDSLADVGTIFSQTVLNNNFASLAAKVDALIAGLKRHGLMGS